mmetsp:Transcript_54998/g.131434  ORF Transcript_54998/g.131434 Transcript_54998/m.131434 type:complete len:200 (-) Transcript_54998:398-997(-)
MFDSSSLLESQSRSGSIGCLLAGQHPTATCACSIDRDLERSAGPVRPARPAVEARMHGYPPVVLGPSAKCWPSSAQTEKETAALPRVRPLLLTQPYPAWRAQSHRGCSLLRSCSGSNSCLTLDPSTSSPRTAAHSVLTSGWSSSDLPARSSSVACQSSTSRSPACPSSHPSIFSRPPLLFRQPCQHWTSPPCCAVYHPF